MTKNQKTKAAVILNYYGVEAQEGMAIEERAELIAALRHTLRGRATMSEVIDEIADVTIMMQQLAFIYGEEAIDCRIDSKLERQMQRICGVKPDKGGTAETVCTGTGLPCSQCQPGTRASRKEARP